MRAIAQMKPTISRAIAVVTTTFGLPIAARPHVHEVKLAGGQVRPVRIAPQKLDITGADIAHTTGPALSRRCL
jgi:hypothetical protein